MSGSDVLYMKETSVPTKSVPAVGFVGRGEGSERAKTCASGTRKEVLTTKSPRVTSPAIFSKKRAFLSVARAALYR
jgi:hypothetical protein